MRFIGNILWHFPFFGFITAGIFFLIGSLLTLTAILSPIGLGLIQYSKFLLWPFGNQMVPNPDRDGTSNQKWIAYSSVIMVLYLPFGLIFATITAIQGFFLFVSIIGIPPALVLFGSLSTLFNPVGKKCVSLTPRKDPVEAANKKLAAYYEEQKKANPSQSNVESAH